MKTKKLTALVAIAAIISLSFAALSLTGCDNNSKGEPNSIPTTDDYVVSGTGTFDYDGTAKAVTVTPREGKSPGAVTVYYYEYATETKTTTAPSERGQYTVRFDVKAADGWDAAQDLYAGYLAIGNFPVAEDYTISGTGIFVYNGSAKKVTVTPKTGKSAGAVTVHYWDVATWTELTEAPSEAGMYDVSFYVEGAGEWDEVWLSAGNIIILNSAATTLTADTWIDGNITSPGGDQWFQFTAVDYENQEVIIEPGTLNGARIELYDSNGRQIGYGDMQSGAVYYARVIPYNEEDTGTYQIAFNTTVARPGAIQLTADTWADGNIADANSGQWFKFTATAATQFIHFKAGTFSQAYMSVYGNTDEDINNPYNNTYIVTSGNEYYIHVRSYWDSENAAYETGTYQIGFSATPAPIGATITTLTADTWTNGNIAGANGEQWFRFTATAATQFVHFKEGTLTDRSIAVCDNTGNRLSNYSSTSDGLSATVTSGKVYYIKVTPPYPYTATGTYQIGFNAALAPPGVAITQLTEDTFANGSITLPSGSQDTTYNTTYQWFKFTATAATQYFHFEPDSHDMVRVNLYDNNGANVNGFDLNSGTTPYASGTVTIGKEYYLRVNINGYYEDITTYTYKIKFTNPDALAITLPTTGVTELTANTWADGNITDYTEPQWFRFTATAANQYFHFSRESTVSGVYVQLYDTTGAIVAARSFISDSYASRTLTIGKEYYIMVRSDWNTGTYKIAFNAIAVPPDPIQLTANTWADGERTSNSLNYQWFAFTATAASQYIHFNKDTITSVTIYLHDDTGTQSGSWFTLSGDEYKVLTVTSGRVYYMHITPASTSESLYGTYQIGFTTSATKPNN